MTTTEKLGNFVIDITPDKSLLPKIGDSGHNFPEAVAEFIDNCIDASTPEQISGEDVLKIDIIVKANKKFFSITDNASGMDEKTAVLAATLAKSQKDSKMLGTYGLGLQSGLMTISDNFTVSTAMKGNDYRTEFEYNHNDWVKNNVWSLPARNVKKEIDDHGTTITINKVTKVRLNPAKTYQLKLDIGKRYRSFIQRGNIKITVNGSPVTVEEVDWSDGYPVDFNVKSPYGEIYGKIGLMKESSQKGFYGFDIFRNNRMIVTNSKFAIGQHPTTARISGEIHLDFVQVSHEKNKFIVESQEYITAEELCRECKEFRNILREAKKKNEEGASKKETAEISESIHSVIPLLAQAIRNLEYDLPLANRSGKDIRKTKTGFLEGMSNLFKPKERKPYVKKDEPKSDYPKNPDTNKPEEKFSHGDVVEINGKMIEIVDEYVYDRKMGRKKFEFDEKNLKLIVYINKGYGGFRVTKDKTSYCQETVFEAVADYILKNDNNDSLITNFYEHRENIMIEIIDMTEKRVNTLNVAAG